MRFALAGVGYIAEKHLQAIKALDGELIAACDLWDSVGILDKYFPEAKFFRSTKEFAEYLKNNKPDYLSICTPNWTHLEYLQLADRLEVKSICEKPAVLYPYELNQFNDTNAIVQLRYSNQLSEIKPINGEVVINYSTPRGDWYNKSWKGNEQLSGGLLMNIGIHLFDLMIFLFGPPSQLELSINNELSKSGSFYAGEVKIRWVLSIDYKRSAGRTINGVILDVDGLHTRAYKEIIEGRGFKKESIKEPIELINEYRQISKSI